MNTIDAIMQRKSIRKFTDEMISDEALHKILAAGMAGPSAVNMRPWSFIVVRDREKLSAMAEINGRAGEPLKGADVGILICGDLSRTYSKAQDYWVVDASIAAQNMILAATELGIGSVWLGTWPQEKKIKGQSSLFELPETIVPHSIIAFGYPAESLERGADKRFEEDRIHYEKY